MSPRTDHPGAGALSLDVRKTWGRLASVAAALIAIVGTFVLPPPFAGDNVWTLFPKFMVAFVVGCLALPMTRRAGRGSSSSWLRIAITLVIAGAVGLIAYYAARDLWTVDYEGHAIVVGWSYIPDAVQYARTLEKQLHHVPSAIEMLKQSSFQRGEIWPEGQLIARQLSLDVLYTATLMLLASAVLCLVQALTAAGLAQRSRS